MQIKFIFLIPIFFITFSTYADNIVGPGVVAGPVTVNTTATSIVGQPPGRSEK